MKKSKVAIILPAFNEAKVIESTLNSIRKELSKDKDHVYTLIVVDDGSSDRTRVIASKHSDITIHHRINRGLGAALATGLEYIRRDGGYKYAITFDSDGQHSPKDIQSAVSELEEGVDVVIGSRFISGDQKFPKMRKIILQISNVITYLFFQVWTTDSQSGFRGFSKHAIEDIRIRTNQMEVSSEFFSEIRRHKLFFTEIPITVKYTKHSMQKGQSNSNGFKVLIKLLYKLSH